MRRFAALIALAGILALAPAAPRAEVVLAGGWHGPGYGGYWAPPPPRFYGPPRVIVVPPPRYYGPPRFYGPPRRVYGPPPWARPYRYHGRPYRHW